MGSKPGFSNPRDAVVGAIEEIYDKGLPLCEKRVRRWVEERFGTDFGYTGEDIQKEIDLFLDSLEAGLNERSQRS